jgi:2-polyprenyl-3-methyl-5-hydroxy-6-metoxy-1,4-benzoquinol methylase
MAVHERYKEYTTDQRDFFDALITEEWDSYSSEAWDQTRKFEIQKLFDKIQPKTILDIGCGCGFHDKVMAEYSFVKNVDAFDYSEKSVDKANEAYAHLKVCRFVDSIRTFSPRRKYNLVVSFQVFEHLDKVDEYFSCCIRSADDDGYIAIFTPNRLRYENIKRKLLGKPLLLLDPQHYSEYTVSDIVTLGARFGLKEFGSFGYGLEGASWANRLGHAQKLMLGNKLPFMAHGICVILSLGSRA